MSRLPPSWLDFSPLQLELEYADEAEPNESESPHRLALYSPVEVLSRKDFGEMSETELIRAKRLIASMARQMATVLSQRKKARTRAHGIDGGRTMRQSLRYGGEVFDLKRRGPKVGKTKMVVLCDISGSMNVYTQFLLQFLYGVQNGL
ncbi:hypothetical protein C2W62_17545 [Candidatus Entotheonella serta]|nr:hypothetical protein C2W62_17545 [Candidatus Entotheonella serta]